MKTGRPRRRSPVSRWYRHARRHPSFRWLVAAPRQLPVRAMVPGVTFAFANTTTAHLDHDVVAELTLHPPAADWRCATCHEEWPCLGARSALLVEYADARAALGMYLAAQMADFVIAAGAWDVPTYDRFLGWVRPSEPAPAWLPSAPTGVHRPPRRPQ